MYIKKDQRILFRSKSGQNPLIKLEHFYRTSNKKIFQRYECIELSLCILNAYSK